MKTKEDVQAALMELRKCVEKTARCIDQAARNTDPGRNAELMRSLHSGQDALNAARRSLERAHGLAQSLGSTLVGLLPDAETLKVA